ncbi:iron chaperone [Alteraurantiacibacter aquimixticola]|uniref:DUF1801 domain-containing protein n=1 Tax=Alteraurantiacibacter aquimixticola TaxID=2489173 RepID=A0A4T3EWF6_9SPHN|nr:DUF1801 domain-containing protein [Alteraurantiacibacter aquimixticola]TIX48885.1 DUF1801 domain-containing protein [Alteraurantiacibacter aquimixticola]
MAADPHAAYFATLSPELRERLTAIRSELEARIPGTERVVAYKMPALRKGRVIAYFAAFKQHIGIYPPVTAPPALVAELAQWRGPKGNLSFPHAEPLPLELIGRVGEALAAQYGQG